MGERLAWRPPSTTPPAAPPAPAPLGGPPASIIERLPPQTLAIELEPFDSVMSETMRSEYGNSASVGRTGSSARRASAPWPISRREVEPKRPTSPTEKGGKVECTRKRRLVSP